MALAGIQSKSWTALGKVMTLEQLQLMYIYNKYNFAKVEAAVAPRLRIGMWSNSLCNTMIWNQTTSIAGGLEGT
eukprot:3248426-Ditylum_brightwellii.AAC.1